MEESMKRLALFVVAALMSACGAEVRATVPEPVVTVGVNAPAPPAPPDATATVDVDVDPPQTGEPEEVQATSEPPDPVYEEQIDSPNPAYVWVGGYWGWNGVDWGWNWGHWAAPPEGGGFYIEPYYERVGGSVVYVHGYWGPHDAPRRSYGGDRITFTAAVRPAGYVRGQHVVVEHRAGPAPGKRPGGAYVHATGTVRPVPHDSVPHRALAATASAHATATARGGEAPKETSNAHASAAGHETTTGHETAGHETTTHETSNTHEAAAGHETTTKETTTKDTTRDVTNRHEAAAGHEVPGKTETEKTTTRTTTTTTTTKAAPAKGAPQKKK
jgi:hypothetical protein